MIELIDKPIRGKMTNVMATFRPKNQAAFVAFRAQLAETNTHFNGAAEMLERIEAALKLTTGFELPFPNQFDQNGNMTLSLVWDDLSLIVNHQTIMWRIARTGEPRHVNDAATAGVPLQLIDALAGICRLRGAVPQFCTTVRATVPAQLVAPEKKIEL